MNKRNNIGTTHQWEQKENDTKSRIKKKTRIKEVPKEKIDKDGLLSLVVTVQCLSGQQEQAQTHGFGYVL